MFSKTCEYGIRAIIYIANASKKEVRVGLKEITKEIDAPEAFTAKILQILVKQSILDSVKGRNGGFAISLRKMESIKLCEVVFALDGDKIYNGCALGLKKCNEKKPCALHDKFQSIRQDLKNMLTQTSIYELSEGLEEGVIWLKR